MSTVKCEACEGIGWLETTEETIERCDTCKVFPSDEAAAHAAAVGQFTFTLDNSECRDVLNAVAAWTDDLKQRGLKASDRVGALLQRLIEETRRQQTNRN